MFQKLLIICMTSLQLLVPAAANDAENSALPEDGDPVITVANTPEEEDAEEDSPETTESVSVDAVITAAVVSENNAEKSGIAGGISSITSGILETVSDVQSTVEDAKSDVANRMDIYASLPRKINVLPTVILAAIVLLETAGLVWILLRKLKKEENETGKNQTGKEKKAAVRDASVAYTPTSGSHSLKLEIESGSLVNPEVSFTFDEQVLIGRASICNIVFNDSDVSKLHARIYFMDGTYYIENLSLKKATYLADMQIQRMNPLDNGDVIQIGSARFKIHF